MTILPPRSKSELCLSFDDAAKIVGLLEERDPLLERVNLLESRLRISDMESSALRDAVRLTREGAEELQASVTYSQTRIIKLEKQLKRAKRGRWIWGAGGAAFGVLVTALALSLTGG